jgi:hypothetical protein
MGSCVVTVQTSFPQECVYRVVAQKRLLHSNGCTHPFGCLCPATSLYATIFNTPSMQKCLPSWRCWVCVPSMVPIYQTKEEAQDRSLWRTQFGRGSGPVTRQTTTWLDSAITQKTTIWIFIALCSYNFIAHLNFLQRNIPLTNRRTLTQTTEVLWTTRNITQNMHCSVPNLSTWFTEYTHYAFLIVDSTPEFLHHDDWGIVADILDVHAAPSSGSKSVGWLNVSDLMAESCSYKMGTWLTSTWGKLPRAEPTTMNHNESLKSVTFYILSRWKFLSSEESSAKPLCKWPNSIR